MSDATSPVQAIRQKIAAGKAVYGMFSLLGEPALVEMIGYAGMDFTMIDTEHSPNTTEQALQLVRAADAAKVASLIRVTANSPELILRAMDCGAGGVLVPQVNTVAETVAAVRASRYAPQGERGLAGVVRAARYGFTPLPEYLLEANQGNLVITQVEHVEAVKNLDAILEVAGLDGIFVGPSDLSQSMGRTGNFKDPELRKTIHTIIEKTRRTEKWAGIFCLDAADAAYWASAGAQFIAVGTDSMLFASALRNLRREVETK